MARQRSIPAPSPALDSFIPSNPPSFVDRFPWVDRLLRGGSSTSCFRLERCRYCTVADGVYAVVGFNSMQVWLPTRPPTCLGYPRLTAAAAPCSACPAFRDDAEFTAAHRITTLPV
jgi:hypothetical protein